MNPCDANAAVADFGRDKTAALLRAAVGAINDAAHSPRPKAVHKMRVSIRRLQQSVRLFRQFLRKKGVRSVRADLRSIMDLAGELRNLDIALGLVRPAGATVEIFTERRVTVRLALQGHLKDMTARDLEERWLRKLGITGEENLED